MAQVGGASPKRSPSSANKSPPSGSRSSRPAQSSQSKQPSQPKPSNGGKPQESERNKTHKAVNKEGGAIKGEQTQAGQQGLNVRGATEATQPPSSSTKDLGFQGTYKALSHSGGTSLLQKVSASSETFGEGAGTGDVGSSAEDAAGMAGQSSPLPNEQGSAPATGPGFQESGIGGGVVSLGTQVLKNPSVSGPLVSTLATVAGAIGGEDAKKGIEEFFKSPWIEQIDRAVNGPDKQQLAQYTEEALAQGKVPPFQQLQDQVWGLLTGKSPSQGLSEDAPRNPTSVPPGSSPPSTGAIDVPAGPDGKPLDLRLDPTQQSQTTGPIANMTSTGGAYPEQQRERIKEILAEQTRYVTPSQHLIDQVLPRGGRINTDPSVLLQDPEVVHKQLAGYQYSMEELPDGRTQIQLSTPYQSLTWTYLDGQARNAWMYTHHPTDPGYQHTVQVDFETGGVIVDANDTFTQVRTKPLPYTALEGLRGEQPEGLLPYWRLWQLPKPEEFEEAGYEVASQRQTAMGSQRALDIKIATHRQDDAHHRMEWTIQPERGLVLQSTDNLALFGHGTYTGRYQHRDGGTLTLDSNLSWY